MIESAENPFAMLQQAPQSADYAYEKRTGVVEELLANMKEQVTAEKTEKDAAEANSVSAYNTQKATTELTKKNTEKERDDLTARVANGEANRGEKQKELSSTEQQLKDLKKVLQETKTDCAFKADVFKTNQKVRAEEEKALSEAIAILSGKAAQAGGSQMDAAVSATMLLQLRTQPNQERLVNFLKNRGQNIDSKMLVQLAETVSAGPFDKVVKMIRDLINRLQEESMQDQTEATYCKGALDKNKVQTENAEKNLKEAQTALEKAQASKQKAEAAVKRLTEEIAANKKESKDAVAVRSEERMNNERTIKESAEGVTAVEEAISVLQNFYANQASLVQQPEYAGEKYVANEGGVITALETLMQDMDNLKTKTEAAEAQSQKEHEDWLTAQNESLRAAETEKRNQQQKAASEAQKIQDETTSVDESQAELDLLKKNYDEVLAPKCVEAGVSFETRNQKRQEEIQSLQEALAILQEI